MFKVKYFQNNDESGEIHTTYLDEENLENFEEDFDVLIIAIEKENRRSSHDR